MSTKISVSSVLTLLNSLILDKGDGETFDSFAIIYFLVRSGLNKYIVKVRREKCTIW